MHARPSWRAHSPPAVRTQSRTSLVRLTAGMPYVVPLRQGHPVQSLHRLPPDRHSARAPSPEASRPRSCCRVLEAAARDGTAGSLTGRPDAASQVTAGNLSPNPRSAHDDCPAARR